MATTDFGALSAAKKKVWAMDIARAGRETNFLFANGFASTGGNTPVQYIRELTKTDRGEECIMQLVPDLVEDGIAGDRTLTGNEESMYGDAQRIIIDQLRHGVKSKGRMSEQRTIIRFREQARDKLGYWSGRIVDEMAFLTIAGIAYTKKLDGATRTSSTLPSLSFAADVVAPSSGRIMYAGTATSTATLTTSDKMTWNLAIEAQALAKRNLLKPIRSGGKDHYILALTTEQTRDLKVDSTYQTNVGRAAERGRNNPLFTNAIAVIDGIIIHEHNRVPTTLGLASSSKWGSGGTVDGGQALLLGAQALGYANLGDPNYEEAEVNDYGNAPGIGVDMMMGMLKPQFVAPVEGTKQDFGVLSIYTAAAATT
ncbi:hypothetical protein UFOVP469_14 [uncultured Caudovirales phage]|uniref:N4-gp56 family major capsid protein n=1 Tax=uncultured Caudovirales phage TaxID=2100421 RepID=A0A6J5MGF8_9CAUD|nr:hypothetical protein UFOVP469_14 [uncultured Caudovirales phage]CAB4190202.1 hypothetical protein UFOVP1200_44 [uncultured Caudovirales phage]